MAVGQEYFTDSSIFAYKIFEIFTRTSISLDNTEASTPVEYTSSKL